MKIKITGETSCDLSPELIKKYNIGISYTHIDKDNPENKGVNGIRIYESSNDKAESLTIGIYKDKRILL